MQADKPGSVPQTSLGCLSFIWSKRCRQDQSAYPTPADCQAIYGRAALYRSLFGLSTRKVFHAPDVTIRAVGTYSTFSPFPRSDKSDQGSLFSVALSVPEKSRPSR